MFTSNIASNLLKSRPLPPRPVSFSIFSQWIEKLLVIIRYIVGYNCYNRNYDDIKILLVNPKDVCLPADIIVVK